MNSSREPIECVVLGASAGGVEAINEIFSRLAGPLPIPVVIVLHLSANAPFWPNAFESGPLGGNVKEAEDKENLCAGTVYFAPPDYHLLLEADRSLSLSSEDPVFFARPSIDVLFESAAYAFGNRILGILLTGANRDGARGLAAIHAAGGTTCVQNPPEARFAAMPQAALDLFEPDMIMTLREISEFLNGQTYSELFQKVQS